MRFSVVGIFGLRMVRFCSVSKRRSPLQLFIRVRRANSPKDRMYDWTDVACTPIAQGAPMAKECALSDKFDLTRSMTIRLSTKHLLRCRKMLMQLLHPREPCCRHSPPQSQREGEASSAEQQTSSRARMNNHSSKYDREKTKSEKMIGNLMFPNFTYRAFLPDLPCTVAISTPA